MGISEAPVEVLVAGVLELVAWLLLAVEDEPDELELDEEDEDEDDEDEDDEEELLDEDGLDEEDCDEEEELPDEL